MKDEGGKTMSIEDMVTMPMIVMSEVSCVSEVQ